MRSRARTAMAAGGFENARAEDKPALVAFLEKTRFNSIDDPQVSVAATHSIFGDKLVTHAQVSAETHIEETSSRPLIDHSSYTLINGCGGSRRMDRGLLTRPWHALPWTPRRPPLTPAKAELVGISLAYGSGKAAYIPRRPHVFQRTCSGRARPRPSNNCRFEDGRLSLLKPVLEDESVLKVASQREI
jgi:hypothetical protein